MELSVVVPTLNGRERLVGCLDALAEHAPQVEVIVVNGPSADGTTGMVRDRHDVSTLVEVSDRNLNVARNAGIATATGDAIAFMSQSSVIEASWTDGARESLENGADVVTGPVHRKVRAGVTTETAETTTVAGRSVSYFDGGNVVLTRDIVERMDGFDEYLKTGGARDIAHRIAGVESNTVWNPDVSVLRDQEQPEPIADRDWGWKYRALSYRLVKNYGVRPSIVKGVFRHAILDALDGAKGVTKGEVVPTSWMGCGRDVLVNIAIGHKDGVIARTRDRTPRRNSDGVSMRADRAVERYDWR